MNPRARRALALVGRALFAVPSEPPDDSGSALYRTASTDGIGGRTWFLRFLIAHLATGAGVLGLLDAPTWGDRLPLVGIAAAGAAGSVMWWRAWRARWREVNGPPRR